MDEPNQNVPVDDNDDEDLCSICLEPFTNKALTKDCLHNFCYQCIYSWVQLRPVCPLCLEPVKAIESKLNNTYYLPSKNDHDGTSDVGDSAEEEESDLDLTYSDFGDDDSDSYSEDDVPHYADEDHVYDSYH